MLIAHQALRSDKVSAFSPKSLIERILTASGRIFSDKDVPITTQAHACSSQQHAGFVDTRDLGMCAISTDIRAR